MIVNKNTNPERDLYFLGSKVIEILNNTTKKEVDFFELFHDLNAKRDISLKLFSLVLDWLFMLGVIKNGKSGKLEKCF